MAQSDDAGTPAARPAVRFPPLHPSAAEHFPMDLVIGLDSGTTATKAVAVAADATVITTSSVGYPLLVPSPATPSSIRAIAGGGGAGGGRSGDAGPPAGAPGGRALPQRGDARAGAAGSARAHRLGR